MSRLVRALMVGLLVVWLVAACGPTPEELAAVDYTPVADDGWETSTPEAEGLDPDLMAQLFYDAGELESLYGLVVVKNGKLIAEDYFNEGSVDQLSGRQSITKSVLSALYGIALERGDLEDLDAKMVDSFPELVPMGDPRKAEITTRQLLQMRGGYPWEQAAGYNPVMWDGVNNWVPHIETFELTNDPGTDWAYSNLSSHILSVTLSRAIDGSLVPYANEHLFEPIGAQVPQWTTDADGYEMGCIEVYLTARDMAKFGVLYLNDGAWDGEQIISESWVEESLTSYSSDVANYSGQHYRSIGYGYQWWVVESGDHTYWMARGHGGQQIVLLEDHNMVIVATADPLYEGFDGAAWDLERSNLNVVADFIKELP